MIKKPVKETIHSKEDIWDNVMRIKSAQVAEELLEISIEVGETVRAIDKRSNTKPR
ncbi:hypothetical protein [Diplocloster agilis]|uniref:Uncharacterized protein n=1 Tax=Diplocloster agilis TaxID=2850323 RepID=A0A949JZD2_9FIRM|nr:hypothetical protein [Diplocloster agilis]MBU9738023.1 hypothetical protein [Diplocloster agilis]MBU9746042.1 hypothetical protein [Diplocloster agilis]